MWQGLVSLIAAGSFGFAVWSALPAGHRHPRLSLDSLAQIKAFAGGMAAVALLSLLLTQMDKILLSRLLSLEAFARYSLAAVLANGLAVITAPIATVLIPE